MPSLAPSSGWHARSAPAAAPCPPYAVASNIVAELPGGADCNLIHPRALARFPRTGVRVSAAIYGRQDWAEYPRRRLPLRLTASPLQHCFEGIPCSFAFQQLQARVGGWNVHVFVLYGRARPSLEQRRGAARVVATLTLRRP